MVIHATETLLEQKRQWQADVHAQDLCTHSRPLQDSLLLHDMVCRKQHILRMGSIPRYSHCHKL